MADAAVQVTVKVIQVRCEGAGLIELDDLLALQGKLKTLTPENEAKLTRELTETGFAFPFQLWREPGTQGERKRYIIDGHQRLTVLTVLREKGWVIPPLPFNWVDADTKQEAMRRVLQATSSYGKMTSETLRPFLEESGIRIEEFNERFHIPQVYLDSDTVNAEAFFTASEKEKANAYHLTLKFTNETDFLRVKGCLAKVDAEPEKAMLKIAEQLAHVVDAQFTEA